MGTMMTADQVAEFLQVPTSWVYKHTKKHAEDKLPHRKLGKYVRFVKEEVEAFVEKHRRL